MHHTPIARLTGLVLTAAAVMGLASAVSAGRTIPVATVEAVGTIAPPTGDDLPGRIEAPTTTTTTTIVSTTTTAPPTTTTAPPTTTPPTTAPPVTAPPVTTPPTTVAPPPPPPPPAPVAVPAPSMNSCESDTMRWMNEARAANGAGPLTADGGIIGIARSWAAQLLDIGSLLHNPDYASQVFAARPQARQVAENVGRSSGSVRGVFDSFMASTGHRTSILNPAFTHAAAGCTVDATGQHWIAVNFWG
ncbi:MAG: CAP domain-containing protein [Acidimicrobiales bacterium]|nr:CAP domain-containing protein [Acidimicrobiales bacterium]